MTKLKAAFFSDAPQQIERVYGAGRQEFLQKELDFYPAIVSSATFQRHQPALRNLELVFSTWGMPVLNAAQVSQLPALKAVFYAAGSVQTFGRPFLHRGVHVVSAWGAIAGPVAEFVTAQIILAVKGYFTALHACRTPEGRAQFVNQAPGMLDTPVSLLGAGMVGTRVIEKLKSSSLKLLVFDPYLEPARAEVLGVKKVTLDQAFRSGFVVSNHLADLPETKGLLVKNLFECLQPNATFINSGRGATVDETGMLEVLRQRSDLTALLDVTDPEPPLPSSPLYKLDNVLLTPHMAGSNDREVLLAADCVIEEYRRYLRHEPLHYAVSLEMLKTMA